MFHGEEADGVNSVQGGWRERAGVPASYKATEVSSTLGLHLQAVAKSVSSSVLRLLRLGGLRGQMEGSPMPGFKSLNTNTVLIEK